MLAETWPGYTTAAEKIYGISQQIVGRGEKI